MKSYGWCVMMVMVMAMSVVAVLSDESFKSDPRVSSAEDTGVALALMDHMKTIAKKTREEITRLMTERADLRTPLQECADFYQMIVDTYIPMAVIYLNQGDRLSAEIRIDNTANRASNCEGGFKGQSPLTALTNSLRDVAHVVLDTIRRI